MSTGLVRVTVVGTDNELDISMPYEEPILGWLPRILHLTGDASGDIERADGWMLSTPEHGALNPRGTLGEAGISDGTRIFLTRRSVVAEAPFIDDVIHAVEAQVDERYTVWRDVSRRQVVGYLVFAVLVLTVGWLLAFGGAVHPESQVASSTVAGLVAVAVLAIVGGWIGSRHDAAAMGWAAIPALAGCGYCAGAQYIPDILWLTPLIGACVGLTACAAVRCVRPAVAGIIGLVLGTLFGCAAAGIAVGLNAVALAAWTVLPALLLLGYAPRLALSSSGLVALVRGTDEGTLAARSDVEHRLYLVRSTVDVLVYSLAGVITVAMVTVAAAGVWEQGLIALYLSVALLIRSRTFSHTRHVVPLLAAAAASFLVWILRLPYWLDLTDTQGAYVVAGLAGGAALTVGVLGVIRLDDVVGAKISRCYDILDGPLTLGIVPVVFFAQGVYLHFWP